MTKGPVSLALAGKGRGVDLGIAFGVVLILIFVLVVVFPKFADMFSAIADKLPATTLVLMKASHVLIAYWIPLTAGLAGSEAIEMTHPLALFGTGLAEAVQ